MLAEYLVQEWQKLYQQNPKITIAITIIICVFLGTAAALLEKNQREEKEKKRMQDMNYASQVQVLDQTRKNLSALIEFVDGERRNLELSQQALQLTRSEYERLRPLVESDKKVVDAIFSAQESRNAAAQYRERWIGIIIGVFTSLAASIIFTIATLFFKKRLKNDQNPDASQTQ